MSYSEEEARALIVESGKRLLKAGLVERTWGNISARIDDTHFAITPSGRGYESLRPEEVAIVSIEDLSYEGTLKPSSEKGIHAEIYKLDREANFLIHTHQTFATALSIGGEDWVLNKHNEILGDVVPAAEYGMPSTKKLKKNVAFAKMNHMKAKAILMKSHGAFCIGTDAEDAFNVANELESLSRKKVIETVGEQFFSTKIQIVKNAELSNYFGMEVCTGTSPVLKELSYKMAPLYPMIDDLAQIGGRIIKTVDDKNQNKDIINNVTLKKNLRRALRKSDVAFVMGVGAIAKGENRDDAEAVLKVLEKNCVSFLYHQKTGKGVELSGIDRTIQRAFYLKKYKKRK